MATVKKKKFETLVTGKSTLLQEIEWREKNEFWLKESARIAFLVNQELPDRNWDKNDLARRMGVRLQSVSKLLKGQENLTLITLCKLQKVLDVKILSN